VIYGDDGVSERKRVDETRWRVRVHDPSLWAGIGKKEQPLAMWELPVHASSLNLYLFRARVCEMETVLPWL
jgi:hypothetical protein